MPAGRGSTLTAKAAYQVCGVVSVVNVPSDSILGKAVALLHFAFKLVSPSINRGKSSSVCPIFLISHRPRDNDVSGPAIVPENEPMSPADNG